MTEPPTGNVTFLFTDIQGSTSMWERDAQRMRSTLARHDEIVRTTVASHGGHVFKMVGDAYCAAFASAPEALGAALAAQRALFAEPWEEDPGGWPHSYWSWRQSTTSPLPMAGP